MRDKLFIDGKWVAPVKGGTFDVVNPATEEVIYKAPAATKEDVELAVAAARRAFDEGPWGKTTGADRAKFLRSIASKITEKREELAKLETLNSGKPLAESLCDMDDTAGCFNYYADLAEELDKRQGQKVQVPDQRFTVKIRYEPVGVVAAIIPWNYPIMMAAWKLGPALAAGCTVVLKPSELTPITAFELAAILEEVGLPAGVVNVISGFGPEAGEPLAKHPDVDKIAFTGSVPTGSKLMEIAAHDVKNVTLELGGKSPFIVFADADIDKVVEWIMVGIFFNQGQVCSATSRLLVEEDIAPKILDRLKEEIAKIKIGNGLEDDVKLGPLVSKTQHQKVLNYIQMGVEEGAKLVVGGKRPESLPKGYFVEPTVFTDVPTSSRIWKEEIFGPVLAMRTFKDEEEAIKLANDTSYGLAGAVMSKDRARCERVAEKLRAGITWINCSQPTFNQAPWGGYKKSGIGRELGTWGLDAYLQVKQVTSFDADEQWGWYMKSSSS
eukprot:GEZU01037138.1.p1 GENE.GEZU01037138.1~~GEZU01037138.1.p1  ORF type:complete len:496 (+),score=203.08 GEZU01037138.1:106-1593(+)